MKDELISRITALNAIDEYIEEYDYIDDEGNHDLKWCAMCEAHDTITNLPPDRRFEALRDGFKKVCLNRYRALDYRKNLNGEKVADYFIYERTDLNTWSKEAFERGEEWFYAEPDDPDKPGGRLKLCPPRYAYRFTRDLTVEEYEAIFEKEQEK